MRVCKQHVFNEGVSLFLVDGDHLKWVTLEFNEVSSTVTILKLLELTKNKKKNTIY